VNSGPDFAEFYAAAFGPLTSQLHAFVGSHAEAQDLVQEAFCRAYARWSSIQAYEDPQAWVRRVAWNLAVSHWRRGRILRLWRHDLAAPPMEAPDPSRIDLARALAQLPSRQRQVVVLHYLADMPVAEIAMFVGVAEGTVKSWLHRARAALSTLMSVEEAEVSDV
jgi:RNA polymerase sigma-70 factor (ECF subfamily)